MPPKSSKKGKGPAKTDAADKKPARPKRKKVSTVTENDEKKDATISRFNTNLQKLKGKQ